MAEEATAEATVEDPVCGMTVDPRKATAMRHAGRTFYVCSSTCLQKFAKDPTKYAGVA